MNTERHAPAMFDIERALRELTLEEKASLVGGSAFWHTTPIERLGIPRIMVSDGPHGLRAQPGESDHLGLGDSVPATCFPTASAIASSWNPALMHRVGEALGREARAINLSVILGPGINMKRSPLGGRNFEYFSEDPYLAGELAVGIVDGIQSQGVGTSVKHYAANNQETDRLRVDAQIDERTLREIYLPAFERVITVSQPWTVMCAYNKVNGVSVSENEWLLTSILRDEFGFDGLVISDWGAVYDRVAALHAGTDLEMPPALGRSENLIIDAVCSGALSTDRLDASVRRVLGLVAKGSHVLALEETFDTDAHHALAREAAAESIVLLKNDGVLPLTEGSTVAVIGEFARTPRFQGAGSSLVHPTRIDALLDHLELSRGQVPFAAGYRLDGDTDDTALRAEAVQLAQTVDIPIVVIGLPASAESEGFDRTHMRLPTSHTALVREIAAVNPRTVVVLVGGSTVELNEITPHAAALVEAWLGGQAAGAAIADVLTGAVNPSGRLAETFPHRLEHNSSYLNFPGDSGVVRYGEGIFIGYRGYDAAHQDVAFPFGYGLSYTEFEMSDLRVHMHGTVEDGTLTADVTVTVRNTGPVAGAEVVQVYVTDVASTVSRPQRELKGFTKVFLAPGEARQVTIALDQRAFAFWSTTHRQWVVEGGEFVIAVGDSSRDLPLTHTLTVSAPLLTKPLTRDSTLADWTTDPHGRALIDAEVAGGQPGILLSTEVLAAMGSFPMSTLANFVGIGLDHTALDRITAAHTAGGE